MSSPARGTKRKRANKITKREHIRAKRTRRSLKKLRNEGVLVE